VITRFPTFTSSGLNPMQSTITTSQRPAFIAPAPIGAPAARANVAATPVMPSGLRPIHVKPNMPEGVLHRLAARLPRSAQHPGAATALIDEYLARRSDAPTDGALRA